ncbi:MAG: endonuclease MutS2, partial [Bacillota bacterium]
MEDKGQQPRSVDRSRREQLRITARRQLEYDAVVDMVVRSASSSLGASRASEMGPLLSEEDIREAIDETTEMRHLLDEDSPPMGGISDLSAQIRRAERGGVLAPEDLLAVADCLRAGRLLSRYLGRHDELVRLADLAEALDPDPSLESAIRECITEEAQVADGASPELRRIRRSLRDKSEELRRKLEGLLRSPELKNHLQEDIVTQRNGRYVVPVRQESRGKVRGIVHGQSSSGATVFIEPQIVV